VSIQLVVFALDDEEYGIDVLAVNGILRAKKFKIQILPGTDDAVEGMINLRGHVNYIFNLRTKFNLLEKEISEESKFIMLNVNESMTGCIVDEVTDIVKLDDNEVEPAPNFINSCNLNYITGIGKQEDRMIIILDPEKIFAAEINTIQNESAENFV
jgi:purine-binding chemotaxis protein CheW